MDIGPSDYDDNVRSFSSLGFLWVGKHCGISDDTRIPLRPESLSIHKSPAD